MSAEIKTSERLQALAGGIEDVLAELAGEKTGFFLMTFPFDRPGIINFISNAERDVCIDLMRKQLARMEAGMPDIPAHLKN